MLKHVVLFRLKDNCEANCIEARELFLSMKKEIPLIKDLACEINIRPGKRAYDLCLEVYTEDLEQLEQYVAHPYHAETIGNYLAENVTDIAVSDFLIN